MDALAMMDVLYVLLTIGFFALMVAYGFGCRALGRDESGEPKERR